MEHLGYRILPLCEKGIIEDAIDDMKRAGHMAVQENNMRRAAGGVVVGGSNTTTNKLDIGHARSVSVPVRAGEAVIGLGLSLTPVETPTEERPNELGAPR